MLVYLAGPIDAVSPDVARNWREMVHTALKDVCSIYSPAHAFMAGHRADAVGIVKANRRVIDNCDLLFAYLEMSYGFETVREIEYARAQGKPVVIVAPGIRSFGAHDLFNHDTLAEACSYIAELSRRNPGDGEIRVGAAL